MTTTFHSATENNDWLKEQYFHFCCVPACLSARCVKSLKSKMEMHSANPRAGMQSVKQEKQPTGAEGTQRKTISSEQNQIRHTPQTRMEQD